MTPEIEFGLFISIRRKLRDLWTPCHASGLYTMYQKGQGRAFRAPGCQQPVPRKTLFLSNPGWPRVLLFLFAVMRMEKNQPARTHLLAPTVVTCGFQLSCASTSLSVKWEGCDNWGVNTSKALKPGWGTLPVLTNVILITRKLFYQSVFSVAGTKNLILEIHTGNGMFERIIWETRNSPIKLEKQGRNMLGASKEVAAG